jgi:hypothetical protein
METKKVVNPHINEKQDLKNTVDDKSQIREDSSKKKGYGEKDETDNQVESETVRYELK